MNKNTYHHCQQAFPHSLTASLLAVVAAVLLSLWPGHVGAQTDRHVQNKPYIDLRPMHFGILVGMHLQDLELENIGPYMMTDEEGNPSPQDILCEADRWSPGFSVGVLAELRLHQNFSLRITPTMHFGAKHLTFLNKNDLDANGMPRQQTQDLKSTYVSVPIDLKFAAPRWNNHRPYVMAGINPMFNLTGGDQDMVRLKKFTTMFEVGLGCDFYLPFFKLIPELKFCFGLGNSLDTKHINELRDNSLKAYAGSVASAQSKMVVLTFYFE
ncbi:MAG: PorT family protein [Prevotella sp.]|nr:PorT family protein [Prevotella sp.]